MNIPSLSVNFILHVFSTKTTTKPLVSLRFHITQQFVLSLIPSLTSSSPNPEKQTFSPNHPHSFGLYSLLFRDIIYVSGNPAVYSMKTALQQSLANCFPNCNYFMLSRTHPLYCIYSTLFGSSKKQYFKAGVTVLQYNFICKKQMASRLGPWASLLLLLQSMTCCTFIFQVLF